METRTFGGATAELTQIKVPTIGSNEMPLLSMLSDALSSGWIENGTIVDAGGEKININPGEVFIRDISMVGGPIYYGVWTTSFSNIPIPTNTTRYIYITYSNGSLVVTVATTELTDNHTNVYLGEVHNIAGTLVIDNDPRLAGDFPKRLTDWLSGVIGTIVGSGEIVSDASPSSRYLDVTAGKVYDRHFRSITTPHFNSTSPSLSGTGMISIRSNGSGEYIRTYGISQWPNTQIDDNNGNLVNMTALYFANIWVIRGLHGDIALRYPLAEFALQSDAENESAPATRPEEYNEHGYYIARITFQKSANTYASIKSLKPTIGGGVSSAGSSLHNNLGGLQGGIAGNYWHTTTIPIPVAEGGTGLSTATQGDILYASGANTFSKLAKDINANRYLSNAGTSNNPAWTQVDLTNGVTGILPVGNGGTGATTLTGILKGTGTTAVTIATAGTDYLTPTGNGSGLTGITGSQITGNISGNSANVTGTVAVGNGGTGATTQTASFNALSPNTTKGDIIVHNGTNNVRMAVGANNLTLTADSTAANGVSWQNAATVSGALVASNNLSDVASAQTSRNNLSVSGGANIPSFYPLLDGTKYYLNNAGSGFSALSLGYHYVYPVVFEKNITITKIAVHITTAAASSTFRLGVYQDNGSLYPGTLLSDSGDISSATTGLKSYTFSPSALSLAKGIYWYGIVCSSGSVVFVNASSYVYSIPLYAPNTGLNSTLYTANYRAVGYGAFPNPWPSTGTTFYAGNAVTFGVA